MKAFILFLLFFLNLLFCIGQEAFSAEILADPKKYAREFESAFTYREVPVYAKNSKEKSIILKNAYASAVLQLPVSWPLKLKQYYIKEVRVIFTKYPVDKNFWNTNYYELLAARLQTIFSIDPKLNDAKVGYTLVLQTQCKTEEEAKLMLHGIEIVYELGERKIEEEEEEPVNQDTVYHSNPDSIAWVQNMSRAWKFLKKSKVTDTVVLSGLEMFDLQDSLLIVVDCTGSMAPYYSQISLWAARNFYPGHYYVMVTDGGSRSLPLGATGGYVDGRINSITALIKLFKKAASLRGGNKETAENDIEGLLVGLDYFPDNKGVILVADNANCIRDYKLLGNVNQPVHIIPCGGTFLNPIYLTIAWYTGGSVIWENKKMNDWNSLCDGKIFFIGSDQYRFLKKQQRFEALDQNGKHLDLCDSFNTKIKQRKVPKKN